MSSKLPMEIEPVATFWYDYNVAHANEHRDFVAWINSILAAVQQDIRLPNLDVGIIDPNNPKMFSEFFVNNWRHHMFFYDYLNLAGNYTRVPIVIFPRNYPSQEMDFDVSEFLLQEHRIHTMIWRAIYVVAGYV